MCRKLIYLVSFVLVLGLIGAAEAAFDTVGVYDPDDAPHNNQVDQSGAYDSHTGNAGPENVIDLATFQELIGPAFAADAGGVVSGESPDDSLGSDDIIIANFGVNRTKSVNFASTSELSFGSGPSSGNRLPTSGDRRFSKPGGSGGNYVFDIGAVTGGAPGEVITYFAGTVLYRDDRELNPQVTATFSGGGTITAIADMPMGAPGHSKDAFFGFVAPPGEGIVNVTFLLASFTNMDDIAFITSAFVVVSEEASDPSPANGVTDVPRDVVLSWTPGEYADKHNVYFGTDFDNVSNANADSPLLVGPGLDPNTFDPGRLEFDQSYYWRVDEVNAPPDSTILEGEVWQFTVEPFSYPIDANNIAATASSSNNADMGPENTINSSELDANDLHSMEATDMWLSSDEPNAWIEYELDKVYKLHEMWVWNSNQAMEPMFGLGCKDVSIEYSVNGTDYTTLAGVPEFAQAPGAADYAHNTTVDFGGAAAKYVRLTANSNWGGFMPQYGLSEVRFLYIPLRAREPQPDSGTTDVAVDVTLGFRAGREAAEHNVYLSSDEQAVIDGNAPVNTVTDASYGPLSIDLDTTYYWKINEVNVAETPTTWQGDIWSFTTQEYFVVEDFENYNDYPPDEIWSTWVDGYGVPANGATAGHPAPDWNLDEHYVETTIVHGGDQSMPLYYDNTTAGYSETTVNIANLQVGQDWTKHGIKALTLRFFGDPNNAVEQMYVKLNGSKVTYDGDAENLKRIGWQMWYIDLASLGVSLSNVTELSIGFERIGAVGGQGVVYFDGIRLYSHDRQVITPVDPGTIGLQAHYEFEGTYSDSSGNARHGTAMGSPTFVAGKVGQAISLRGLNDYVEITGYKGILGPNAFSITAWIKTTYIGDETQEIVYYGTHSDGQRCEFRVHESGYIRMGNGAGQVVGLTAVTDGGWHHVAATVIENATASSGDITCYVDGQDDTQESTDPDAFDIVADWDVTIGYRPSQSDRFFNGQIDDVRIYDRVLSQEEIAWLAGRTMSFDKPF